MKKRLLVSAVALALLVPCALLGQSPQTPVHGKVLLVIRNQQAAAADALGFVVEKEAGTITVMLQKAGYQVDIASPTGQRWGTSAAGLQPNRKLADVRVADYKAIVIPCLAIESTDVHPDLASVIKAAAAGGTLLASQTGGVTMVAKTGVLAGKKYATIDVTEAPEQFMKGIYAGAGIVKDGTIITSGICPWMAHTFPGMQDGTQKMMETVIAELKAR